MTDFQTTDINLTAQVKLKNKNRGSLGVFSDAANSDLNGFLINQNATVANVTNLTNQLTEKFIIQEFKLPKDVKRNSRVPDLTGIHINLNATATDFLISYDVQVYDQTSGWQGLTFGQFVGTQTGSQWIQINLDGIEIPIKYLNQKFRLVLLFDNNVNGVYYSSINPFLKDSCYLYADSVVQNGKSIRFRLMGNVADEGIDILGNTYRSFVYNESINKALDFNTNTWWRSKANPSKYAVESLYFDLNQKTMIDALYLNPATPNVTFNIYYTDEVVRPNANLHNYQVTTTQGSTSATLNNSNGLAPNTKYSISSSGIPAENDITFTTGETVTTSITLSSSIGVKSATGALAKIGFGSVDNWDKLLWKRIPKDFIANKAQNYVFPKPISTRFVKVEFTSLQASPYLTGDFQKPIVYKKYPQWVFDYFIAKYAYERGMTYDPFIGNQIEINFDLLDLAFNYYKDDIIQSPINPNDIKVVNATIEDLNQTLRELLVKNKDGVNSLDIETYLKVRTDMEPFLNHPATRSNPNTATGVLSLSNSDFQNYVYEDRIMPVGATSLVSNHNRDHLIQEKNMPAMSFFIDCRHGYREALAKLPDNKAYFVGVKEIGFQRHDHKVVSDSSIYLSVAGNDINASINDFEYDGIAWTSK